MCIKVIKILIKYVQHVMHTC